MILTFGRRVKLPGLSIIGPGDHPWARLDPHDYRLRPKNTWIRQIIIHTTKGLWPQKTIPGAGPGGRARDVADYWSGNSDSGGAHLVVDDDGTVLCLCDLGLVEAYHATTSNAWSIGIEMYQFADGRIREATLDATVRLVTALCDGTDSWEGFHIPLQVPEDYQGVIERMRLHGGPDCVGVFGHRDQAWKFPWQLTAEKRLAYPNGYANRGRGDPGDEIFTRLTSAGAEPVNFVTGADRSLWRSAQERLNRLGAGLQVDGVPGPATMRAMRERGFKRRRELDYH